MNQLRINNIEYPNESLSNCPATSTILNDSLNELPKSNVESQLSVKQTNKANCNATFYPVCEQTSLLDKDHSGKTIPDRVNSTQQITKSRDSITKQQKEQLRKQKYNTYMKSYRERKKKELEEHLRTITITFNNQLKSYNKDDIQQILFNCINLLISIINTNTNKFTK